MEQTNKPGNGHDPIKEGIGAVKDFATRAEEIGKDAGAAVAQAGETVGAKTRQLGDSYQRFTESGRECVRNSPVTSVLAAVAVGYGLSKLLGARRH